MLASDLNNPQFVGAQDPDAALVVEFYIRPVQNPFKSSKAGHAIFEDVIYIKIDVPGVKEMQVDRPATDLDQKRFPKHWAFFKQRTEGDAREIGTPLSEWPVLTRSQAEELRAIKFFTIEGVANASDQNIAKMGMLGGMAPHILREKARAFLQTAKDQALPQHQAEELAKRDAEIAQLRKDMERLASQMPVQISGNTQPATTPTTTQPAQPKRKRGRPSKAEIAARQAQGSVNG